MRISCLPPSPPPRPLACRLGLAAKEVNKVSGHEVDSLQSIFGLTVVSDLGSSMMGTEGKKLTFL